MAVIAAIPLLLGCWQGAGEAAEAGKKVLVFELLPKAEQFQSDATADCLFVSHDCEICAMDAEDQPVCSSSGIACVPTERRCYHVKEEPGG